MGGKRVLFSACLPPFCFFRKGIVIKEDSQNDELHLQQAR
jgi:hypothetical protein